MRNGKAEKLSISPPRIPFHGEVYGGLEGGNRFVRDKKSAALTLCYDQQTDTQLTILIRVTLYHNPGAEGGGLEGGNRLVRDKKSAAQTLCYHQQTDTQLTILIRVTL